MIGWKKARLGDCCEITSSKRIFYSDYVESGVPFYRSKEIIESFEGVRNFSETLYITEERYNEIRSRFGVPAEGDLLLTSVGTIGVPYLVKQGDRFYFKDGNLTWFRNFKKTLDSKFLFYWLQTNQGKGELDAHTIGSSQKALTIRGLKEVSIRLPDIEQQQRMISILSDYDSAIDNARRQIALLEEAAMRLYREWFVVNADPKWEKKRLGDVCDCVLGGTPSRNNARYWGGDVAWINSGKVNELRIVTPSEFITREGLNNSATKILPKHTTVLAITGATLGQVSLLEIDSAANQSVVGILENAEIPYQFIYPMMVDRIKELVMCQTGGAQQHINKQIVCDLMFAVPPKDILSKYLLAVNPMFRLESECFAEVLCLTEARDRLLPKLMSGEIKV